MASVTTPRKSKNKEGKKTSTPDSSGSARMDLGERRRHDFDGGSWTDEKHISFLNWMEASFVKRMHERDDQQQLLTYAAAAVDSHLPLDRYLPDGSDSTVDFHNQRPNMNEKKSQANNRRKLISLSPLSKMSRMSRLYMLTCAVRFKILSMEQFSPKSPFC